MRRLLASLLLVLAGAAPPALARGDGTFLAPTDLPLGGTFWAAAADLDGDGAIDLATVHGSSEIRVTLQDPADRTRWSAGPSVTVGNGCYFILAVDLDEDGRQDLAVADPGSQSFVLRGRGDGTFDRAVFLDRTGSSRILGAGDVDLDGVLDVLSTEQFQGVTVLRGRGSMGFDHVVTYPTMNVHDMLLLDFDGDAKLDFVAKTKETGVFPFRGRGDGTFEALPLATNVTIRGPIATADFDGDGRGDLMGDFGARLSNGDGTFRAAFEIEGHDFAPVGAADVTGDGLPDALITDSGRRSLHVRPGRGDGTFLPVATFPLGHEVNAFHVADLDGDGRRDVVLSGLETVQIVWGIPGPRLLSLPASLRLPSPAVALAAADLDRDGSADLLVPRRLRSGVSVLFGPFDEGQARTLEIETTGVFESIEVVDLDEDSIPDLVGTDGVSNVHAALLGADLAVRTEQTRGTGLLPAGVASGRLDGDRWPDLAVPCTSAGEVSVLLGEGDGALSDPRPVPTIVGPRGVALADLDGDGAEDLIVAGRGLATHRGAGDGSFGEPAALAPAGESFTTARAVDLDGDGRPEVLGATAAELRLWRNAGGGALEPRGAILSGGRVESLEVGDLDGDGLPEITASGDDSVRVLRNAGALSFGKPRTYIVGPGVRAHRIADLSLDGALDLVVLQADSATLLLGRTAPGPLPFRRADSDGDGVVNLTDAVRTLSWLFLSDPQPGCLDAADANHDGAVNLTDPIATLNYLFLGGTAPPSPGPETCGPGPEPTVGCEAYVCS